MASWFFFKILFIFREGQGGRKRKRNINVWLPLAYSLLGTWPATQACALTGDQTGDPWVCSLCSNCWATPARARFWCLNLVGNFLWTILLSKNKNSLLLSICMSLFIALAKAFITMVSRSRTDILALFPILERKYSIFYHYILCWVETFLVALYQIE